MKALILAAGEGTRLRPLTVDTPKPMLPLGGQPLIGHLVALLREHKVRQIAVNLHHAPEATPDYLGDGSEFGVQLTYSYEERLLGSAGAAKKLATFLDETFFVLYGDVLTDLDLSDLAKWHRRWGAALTMALHKTDEPSRCGIAQVDAEGMVRKFVEKPREDEIFSKWANAGVYAVEPSLLELIPEDSFFDFGEDLIPLLLERDLPVGAYLSESYFMDIGSFDRYQQAERDLARGAVRTFGSRTTKTESTSRPDGESEDAACTSASQNQLRRWGHRPGGVLRVVRGDGS